MRIPGSFRKYIDDLHQGGHFPYYTALQKRSPMLWVFPFSKAIKHLAIAEGLLQIHGDDVSAGANCVHCQSSPLGSSETGF